MKLNRFILLGALIALLPAVAVAAADGASMKKWLEAVNAVGPEGQGNAAASSAWKKVAAVDAKSIPTVLAGMSGSSELSENWLRSAVEAIADRELAQGGKLPTPELGDFVLNTSHNPRARRLAFELIRRVDADTAERLVPGLLNDPSVELRREAVQRLMDQGKELVEAKKSAGAGVSYRQALVYARDVDQIKTISKQLRDLGRPLDLPEHFGFLMHWSVIGPFDNTKRTGFETVFPPENKIDLTAEYDGKSGKVRWTELVTDDEYGMLDINKAYPGEIKEVTGYAYTEFKSATARPIELRLGCKNAWKVWLNGELLFGRDEYHRGMRIDQYRMRGQLKAGTNTILVKACQNEQKESWTVEWQFQLRACDATGTAVLSADRPPTPKPGSAGKKTAGLK